MSTRNERLTEGLEDNQKEKLGDLSILASLLDEYATSEPTPEQTSRLLARLEGCLETDEGIDSQKAGSLPVGGSLHLPHLPGMSGGSPSRLQTIHEGFRKWTRLAWAQTLLFEKSFWWACGIVLVLGLGLVWLSGDQLPALIFLALAPLLAAAGVAYAFRPETQTLWELEKISPISSVELLYARLGLVLAINTVISLVLLGVVWGQGLQIVLWRMLLAWLGPMLALSGIALYSSVRWGSLVGLTVPLGLWGVINFLGWQQAVERFTETQLAATWLLEQLNQSNWLVVIFLLALAIGLVMLQRGATLADKGLFQ